MASTVDQELEELLDKYDVFVHMSDLTGTGGTTYKEGEYALNQMSPLFVQEKFLALFAKLARK